MQLSINAFIQGHLVSHLLLQTLLALRNVSMVGIPVQVSGRCWMEQPVKAETLCKTWRLARSNEKKQGINNFNLLASIFMDNLGNL